MVSFIFFIVRFCMCSFFMYQERGYVCDYLLEGLFGQGRGWEGFLFRGTVFLGEGGWIYFFVFGFV